MKCTINEYFFYLISVGFYNHFKKLGEQKPTGDKDYKIPKHFKMLMPVSVREKTDNISSLEINNSIVGLPV